MTRTRRFVVGVIREAWRTTTAQVVPTTLTVLVVAGMAFAAVTTAGRAVAAEEAVLAAIDREGTRTVVARARTASDVLTPETVVALDRLHEVELVVGFGPAVGVDPLVARPAQVGLRVMVLPDPPTDELRAPQGTALASDAALDALGFVDGVGTVVDGADRQTQVRGPVELPEAAAVLEPLLVVPRAADDAQGVSLTTVVVVARTPGAVAAVTDALVGIVAAPEPGDVTVETSRVLADARAAVAGELTAWSRAHLLSLLGGAALLVSATLGALVAMRRRDYGRRRALGASRMLVATLLTAGTAGIAFVAALAGLALALAVLRWQGGPLPGIPYLVAVVILSVAAACVGALPPAAFAATRDPLTELRTP